jgi:hypothetical protein
VKDLQAVQKEITEANLALNQAMRHLVNVQGWVDQVNRHLVESGAVPEGTAPTPAPTGIAQRAQTLAEAVRQTQDRTVPSEAPAPASQPAPVPATPTPAPTPTAAAAPTPAAAQPAQDTEEMVREAKRVTHEYLGRTLFSEHGLFNQMLSAEVSPFGRGILRPPLLTEYKEDVSQVARNSLTAWPSGFYRESETGNLMLFLQVNGRMMGWVIITREGPQEFYFYSKHPEDTALYRLSELTDLTQAKRVVTQLQGAWTELLTKLNK